MDARPRVYQTDSYLKEVLAYCASSNNIYDGKQRPQVPVECVLPQGACCWFRDRLGSNRPSSDPTRRTLTLQDLSY
jgi:hypothetical protein